MIISFWLCLFKVSALSSGELEKYEYLTGEDLGYKPDVIQKAKFEYSPLGKVFNKGLDKSDKKEGLLTKLNFRRDSSLEFYFSDYKSLKELFKEFYYRNLSIHGAERMQDEFKAHVGLLEEYKPRNPYHIHARKNIFINAKNLYVGRQMITDAFINQIFPFGVEEPEDFSKGQMKAMMKAMMNSTLRES